MTSLYHAHQSFHSFLEVSETVCRVHERLVSEADTREARHVFGSIIGLHQAYGRISNNKQAGLHAHFTLLDIHPASLARDLCMLVLLDHLDEETRAEVMATLFYIFIGVAIPPYCYNR